jgi:AmiR/NasT family two-component response regulator
LRIFPHDRYYACEESSVKRVRVLVANRPRLMREMVLATIADQPDIEIVGDVELAPNLTELVEQVQPDVLIVALGDDDQEKRPGECGFLLGRYPRMRILALAPEQNRGLYYWAIIDIRTKPVESSEAGILSALRDAPAVVGAARI